MTAGSHRAPLGHGRHVGELRETQVQRTELAWRRTLVGVMAVAGLGSIHLVGGRHVVLGLYVGILSVLAVGPIVARIRRLRRGDVRPMTWEAQALVIGLVALALGIGLFG